MGTTTIDAPATEQAEGVDGYRDELEAAREAEGLDAKSALPVAADDDGSAVDISGGIALEGLDEGQLSFSGVGGKKPSAGKLRVVGGAFDVGRNLEKGSIVRVELALRVSGVGFDDVIDPKTTQPTDCTRAHKGRVIGAVLIDESLIEKHDALREAAQALLDGESGADTVLRRLLA